MRLRRAKLSTKFLVPAVLALVVLAASVIAATALIVQNIIQQMVADYIVEYVVHQADQHRLTSVDFTTGDKGRADTVFFHLAADIAVKGIHRMTIWDKNGNIVFSDNASQIGHRTNDPVITSAIQDKARTAIRKPVEVSDREDLGDYKFLEVIMPYTPSDAQSPAGAIQIYFELNTLNGHIKNAAIGIILAAIALLIIISLVIAFVLRVVIIRPIQQLQSATRRIAAGKLELSTLNISSSDEIGDLARSFEKMSENLKRLEALRNEFFFVATHELRAPVTVLRGYLALLKDRPKELKEYLPDLIDANNRLEELVNGLLDIARTETGKIQLKNEPVDAGKLLKSAVTGFKAAASEKGITVQFQPPVKPAIISADPKRFQEVLENLLSNAVKYGKSGGNVFTSISVTSNQVSLNIRDDGIGISAADQKKLFQKFYRASNALSSGIVGTGLGLYIVKELVTRMGGKISCESGLGEGTSFTVSFRKSA